MRVSTGRLWTAAALVGALVGGSVAMLADPIAQSSSGTSAGTSGTSGASSGASGAGGTSSTSSGGEGGPGAGTSDTTSDGTSDGSSSSTSDRSVPAQPGAEPAVGDVNAGQGPDLRDDPALEPAPSQATTVPASRPDADGDGLADGTSGWVPAAVLTPAAVPISLAFLPLRLLLCIDEFLLGEPIDQLLCPDITIAIDVDVDLDTGASSSFARPRSREQVEVFVDTSGERPQFFLVPRRQRQRLLATLALLLVVVAVAVQAVAWDRRRRGDA